MPAPKSATRRALPALQELAALAFLVAVQIACAKLFVMFYFKHTNTGDYATAAYRLPETGLSLVPFLAVYAVVRLLLSPLASAAVVASAVSAISYGHHVKSALTGDPISFTDITNIGNASIVWHYVTLTQALLVSAGLLVVATLFVVFEGRTFLARVRKHRIAYLLVFAAVSVASFAPGSSTADLLSFAANRFFSATDMSYISYDWPENIRRNGLGIHLVQTSWRHMPEDPTPLEEARFADLVKPMDSDTRRPKTVVMILCEACWNDSVHFRNVFQPLASRGFTELRGISPVYGGGTVNAAFEMITGLPATGDALTGIIYQEYAPVISDHAHALPRYMAKQGYRTVALHNHVRKFWYRNIVNPKLGFQEFLGIEDMTEDPPPGWADDGLLFDAALEELDAAGEQEIFMHLTTVYTHGGYERLGEDDLGQKQYEERLRVTLNKLGKFVDDVYDRDPGALVLIYGDHKPQLTAFFLREGVIPRTAFEHIGSSDMDFTFARDYPRDLVGDMPIYVKHPDGKRVAEFKHQADGRPFFCVSKFLDRTFLRSATPAFRFSGDICRGFSNGGYERTVEAFPDWLYTMSLLE